MTYLLPERSVTTLDYIHCMDALSLLRGLADKSVDALITDMPYGTTACSWDTVIDLPVWWTQVKRVLKPRGVFVTTAAQPFTSALVMSNPKWFKYTWVWNKHFAGNFALAEYKPMATHEDVCVFGSSQANYYPQMTRRNIPIKAGGMSKTQILRDGSTFNPLHRTYEYKYPISIMDFRRGLGRSVHPTQKPVALYEYLIQTYTRPGELVLDPFSGSGTTAIAARKTGRHFICGDSSAEYVEMSRKRLLNSDPYLDRQVTPELKQRSLFAGVMPTA